MGGVFVILIIFCILALGISQDNSQTYEWDDHGYVFYCPAMGQFGNQASHLLGALNFAKVLNRTLAVPHWISHVHRHRGNIPFGKWFDIKAIQKFHKALPLEDFMTQLAPQHWPVGQRTGYCYRARNTSLNDCQMKQNAYLDSFWSEQGVKFDRSEFTGLSVDINSKKYLIKLWNEKYPPDTHPVLAFKGAPASFPVQIINRPLQQYVVWNSHMQDWTQSYVETEMSGEQYIAVHLRIGSDWEKACEQAVGQQSFMESGQCMEAVPNATITQELCLPSHEQITKHIKVLAHETGVHHVFIASDVDPRLSYIKKNLGTAINVHYLNPADPPLDLAVMGRAHYFIGNCVSSFTAFVKRERDVHTRPTEFFGFESVLPQGLPSQKTEL